MPETKMSEKTKADNELAKQGKFGSAVKSGGPRGDIKTDVPVDRDGNPTVHPPDLADNGTEDNSMNFRRGGGPLELEKFGALELQLNQIARAEKADVLYYWHGQERAKDKPRQAILDAIKSRLHFVQGPPYPPEIENAKGVDEESASKKSAETPTEPETDKDDITGMTVADASERIADADEEQLNAWEKAEKKGSNRSGIQNAIDKRRAQLQSE